MSEIRLIQVTENRLEELISGIIRKQLEELKKEISATSTEEYLTRKETSELLKINLSTLSKWTAEGRLSSYGKGGRVYYKRSDIESALIPLNQLKKGGLND